MSTEGAEVNVGGTKLNGGFVDDGNLNSTPSLDRVVASFDPYRHSKVMASRRRLRLKRAAAQAEKDRLGIQSNEGSLVFGLVVHLG